MKGPGRAQHLDWGLGFEDLGFRLEIRVWGLRI